MKRTLSGLILGIILTVLILPAAAFAQTTPQECCVLRKAIDIGTEADQKFVKNERVVAPGGECTITTGEVKKTGGVKNWGLVCLINTFNTVVDWFFLVLVVLAVFFTILGAFSYMTAAGEQEKITKGKDYILYAAIGLAVAFIARAIPSMVAAILG